MWIMMHTINSFTQTGTMAKKKILLRFGEKVRELRKEKNLSQEELSFKADLHRTYIGMIERAEKNITLLNISKIASALEVTVSELLSDIE